MLMDELKTVYFLSPTRYSIILFKRKKAEDVTIDSGNTCVNEWRKNMSSAEMAKVIRDNGYAAICGNHGIAAEGSQYYEFCRNLDKIGSGELDIRDVVGMFLEKH